MKKNYPTKTRNMHIGLQTNIRIGQGLGDLIADVTHVTGLDKLAQGYTNLTGKDCECNDRREKLNKICTFGE